MPRRTVICARCKQSRQYSARGLCNDCVHYERRRGRLADYPRITRSMDETLADYTLLRGQGHHPRDIAARMGMTFAALDRQIWRAKQRGLIA